MRVTGIWTRQNHRMPDLALAWLRTAQNAGARGDVAGAGANLLTRWVEPHRHYHDVHHLRAVLAHIDELADNAFDADLVRLAAWFHDAVYDPTAGGNEHRSAMLARKALGALYVDDASVDEVRRLVELTAAHDPDETDRNGAVLCDADLAVLASTHEDYASYVMAVRAEYEHLDDHTFASGRAEVLRSLANRPALYRTAHGRTHWEAVARDNLTRELQGLT